MKTLDLPTDTPVEITGNVITYASAGYRYMLRFPAAPATAAVHELRDGREQITMGTLDKTVLVITGRASIIERIFEKVGGKPAS